MYHSYDVTLVRDTIMNMSIVLSLINGYINHMWRHYKLSYHDVIPLSDYGANDELRAVLKCQLDWAATLTITFTFSYTWEVLSSYHQILTIGDNFPLLIIMIGDDKWQVAGGFSSVRRTQLLDPRTSPLRTE